ncbi:MAG: GTP cyclohydrolase I FolE2 [Candidatus Cloacimonetes bacterium]|nr:GTP cyclohydrolase I FolE2 [Candidatus Cloacimonadota bacterium]
MKNKKDIQSLTDERNVLIDKVGVKGVRYPITVQDKEFGTQPTIADLDIYVQLPHDHRGTHMSRFLEVLNEYHKDSIVENLENFLKEVKSRLHAEASFVNVRFPYFLKKKAPVSGIESLLDYNCFFEASFAESYDLVIGVVVPVTSLCPCSKEISEHGAHNQRSHITIRARFNEFVWLEDLIAMAEETASCEIYPLLKRVDEKFVTEKAYSRPRFVEDIVREMAVRLRADDRITGFRVESENYESIHNHSAYAFVEENF